MIFLAIKLWLTILTIGVWVWGIYLLCDWEGKDSGWSMAHIFIGGILGVVMLVCAFFAPDGKRVMEHMEFFVFYGLLAPYYLLPVVLVLGQGFLERNREIKDRLAKEKAKWEAERAREVEEILRRNGIGGP